MHMDALDELAATVAAGLEDGRRSRAEIAARAYDIAEALMAERQARGGGGFKALVDALPHHPTWEVEPRWSLADRRMAHPLTEHETAGMSGPGLARVDPPATHSDEAVG